MTKLQPWIKFEEIEKNAGRFVLSPLKRGMGITIGNSLRRVLLSSLSGAAITAVKIEGVEHEFSTIPHVIEDALDIICNLKGIVFKLHSEDSKILKLEFKGKGKVTAASIQKDSEVEIINPNHHIAELTENGKLKMELTIRKGTGYATSDANVEEDKDIRVINVDSSFTPIVRVNHEVENIRVGKELDYDSLKLEVITNGSISPDDAVRDASTILIEQFKLFGGSLNQKPEAEAAHGKSELPRDHKKDSALNLSIDDLELSARSSNCLKRAGIETVGQLVEKGLSELIQIKNFGKKSADEINDKLKQYGLTLKNDATFEDEDEDEA